MNKTPRTTARRGSSKFNQLRTACAGLLLSTLVTPALAGGSILDCPLRDAPYSLDLPLLDILLSPKAKAAVNKHLPSLLEKAPPIFTRTEVPAFATIITLRDAAHMVQIPDQQLGALAQALGALTLTDADRRSRCARYDDTRPDLDIPATDVRILVFDKINGFDHGPSVTAATQAIKALAEQQGWGVTVTHRSGAFTPDILVQFDAVVWNNNSGDVLTLSQRKAFEDYIATGGGYVGIHGAGGDTVYFWDWYAQQLLGAQFIGHPMQPQFQNATVHINNTESQIGAQLMPGWTMKEEWYSFAQSPRNSGASVVASLDESTYLPVGFGDKDLRMGDDHPIAWTRCVGNGRSFYTGIGHRPEGYNLPENLTLLRDGLRWATGNGASWCLNGTEVTAAAE